MQAADLGRGHVTGEVPCRASLQQPEGCMCLAERLVEEQELVMVQHGTFKRAAAMVPVQRRVGQNDVGIVAWELSLRTPECPQGRKVSSV